MTSQVVELAKLTVEALSHLTLTVHVCSEVQLSDVVGLSWLDPDTLPNAAARCVENVRLTQGLLANRNHIVAAVCRVVHKNEPRNCADMLAAEDCARELELMYSSFSLSKER